MDKVRVGIIGMGEIGKYHAGYLLDGKVQRCELVAVCSTSPQKLAPYQAKGLNIFDDGEKLIQSGEVNAAIVATPIHFHCVISATVPPLLFTLSAETAAVLQ